MPTAPFLLQEVVGRKRPLPNPDAVREGVPGRCGRYGEDYALNLVQKSHLLADEGSYFVSSNPTAGTGVAGQVSPVNFPAIGSLDTKPFLVVQNTEPIDPVNSRRVYFDYMRFRPTAVGASGTSINFCVILDAAGAPRAPTGGSNSLSGTATAPALSVVNPNMDDNTAAPIAVWAGNLTVASTQTGRLFPNVQLRPVIAIASDIYIFTFGPTEYGVGSLISSGGGICQQTFGYSPLIIGPQQWALFYLIMPAQAAASSFEYDFGVWAR